MSPGTVHHIQGKVTVRASFGSITYGPRKGAPRGTVIARVLVLPDDVTGADLADWLEKLAATIRKPASDAHDAKRGG
jgi:hypothetical protein